MDMGLADWSVSQEEEEVAKGLSIHLSGLCGLFGVH
jgi:hypothetical protein